MVLLKYSFSYESSYAILLIVFLLISFCNFKLNNGELKEYEGTINLHIDKLVKWDSDKSVYDGGRVRLSIFKDMEDPAQLVGADIKITSALKIPEKNSNPNCFNYALYLKSIGIDYIVSAEDYEIVREGSGLGHFLTEKRIQYLDNFEDPSLISGVLFGDKGQLEEESYEAFQKNGTAHVLAVSGLHIGIIFAGLRRLLKKKNKILYYLLSIAVLLVYSLMTGFAISTVRALILIFTVMFAELNDRPYDLLSALAFAGIIILSFNPFELFNSGFQMSFLAVLSIAIVGKKAERKFYFIPQSLLSTLEIQIPLIPYMAYEYNIVPLLGLFANIPSIFLVGILVPIGMISFLIYVFTDLFLGESIMALISTAMEKINLFAAGSFSGSIAVPSPNLAIVVIASILIFVLCGEWFYVRKHRKEYRKILAVFLALIVPISLMSINKDSRFDDADAIFVDVGQGDALWIDDCLFDSGGKEGFNGGNLNVGKDILRPFLLKNGHGSLDAAYITHNHGDHFKGLEELSQDFQVDNIYFSKNYQALAKELEGSAKADNYAYLDSGNMVKRKAMSVRILWPIKGNTQFIEDDENANSMIMRVDIDGVSFLITGDIDQKGEKSILEYYEAMGKANLLDCDVLKVAHHGSKYSSCDEFIKAVSPEIAIISVGAHNFYGHPSQEAMDRLKNKGAKVLRTDERGAIGFVIEDGEYRIVSMK